MFAVVVSFLLSCADEIFALAFSSMLDLLSISFARKPSLLSKEGVSEILPEFLPGIHSAL